MKHYILTRWNVGVYSENPHGIIDIEKWMNGRHELFEKTRESVLNQKTLFPFEWWILVDPLTPQHHLDLIFTDERMVMKTCQPHELKFEPGWKITTRIDSDDLYLDGAIYTIQSNAKQKELLTDIRYNINGGETVFRPNPNSMFISLTNKNPNVSVWQHEHSKMVLKYGSMMLQPMTVFATRVEHGNNLMRKQGNNFKK